MEYKEIVATIARLFGITEELLYRSTRQDCTDGRALLVHLLVSMGYTERTVCRLTGFSQQRVNYLKNTFRYRRSLEMTNALQTMNKLIGKEQRGIS